ncbi:MAG: hypothetical protein FLDDKLPJ_02047 [Phycisphaerae bacterium]|nr:hypothetical protein [Phycisphaerae bacterium]
MSPPRAFRAGWVAGTMGCALAARSDTPLACRLVADRFDYPIFVTSDPCDAERLFVVERAGRVRLLVRGRTLDPPFLDITDRVVSDGGERGLLSIALHPRFDENGFFYVNYTNPDTVVSRFQVTENPDHADPDSESVLLVVPQPHANHNGGCIQFSPRDGMLYIGMGDGGGPANSGNAQDPTTLLGKMLRLDVDTPPPHVPPDNPFVGDDGVRDEIWAFGLRNPWRFSFDRDSGDLYIADVGEHLREEVSVRSMSDPPGANFGWDCFEGEVWTGECDTPPPDHAAPVLTYPTADGCAIIGGHVYRGTAVPDLAGTYFYADLCNDRVFSFRRIEGEVADFRDRTSELAPDRGERDRIVSFGEDAAGELYMTSPTGGEIFKITPDFCLTHGDATDDCRLDLADVAALQNCFTADGGPPPPGCDAEAFPCLDRDRDADLDLADFAAWIAGLTGPDVCLENCISATCN